MKQLAQNQQPLSEALRLAYLQAMDIPLWVPRDEPEVESSAEYGLEPSSAVCDEGHSAQQGQQSESQVTPKIVPLAALQPVVSAQMESSSVSVQQDDTQTVRQIAGDSGSNQAVDASYLKMVNWRSGSNATANKKLLIICRHQKDQPAQSFARPNAPSQFMHDYLRAIDEYFVDAEFGVEAQLAHLTEAGLGSDASPMSAKLGEINPDVILLLGDEAASYLYGDHKQVAELRGKLEKVNDFNAIVSYHPYTLIKNPALKRLAQEDLRLLAKLLE